MRIDSDPLDADMSITSESQRIEIVARVFGDTATSYKLFWFRGILECLKADWGETDHAATWIVPAAKILREMIVAAWAPACLFRLSFGQRDQLGIVCRRMAAELPLPLNASADAVRAAAIPEAFVRFHLYRLLEFVPALFQAPWFARELRPYKGGRERAKHARRLAIEHTNAGSPPPYILSGLNADTVVTFNRDWIVFLRRNLGVLEGFLDHHLATYLQARNPHSPGVVRKLRMPIRRDMRAATTFWRTAVQRSRTNGRLPFQDIYSQTPINLPFALDHFLPWTFVAHDQLWNLLPVTPQTNSQKGDTLPHHRYVKAAAELHWSVLKLMSDHPKLLLDYEVCFQATIADLLALGKSTFAERYVAHLKPLALVAETQGFEAGWEFRPPTAPGHASA